MATKGYTGLGLNSITRVTNGKVKGVLRWGADAITKHSTKSFDKAASAFLKGATEDNDMHMHWYDMPVDLRKLEVN